MSDDSPLLAVALASMPPYVCKCGHTMGHKLTAGGKWKPVDRGCQPGHCMCPHACAYDCAGCDAHLCMECDEPTTTEQTKTAVKWCGLCRLDGKHIGLQP